MSSDDRGVATVSALAVIPVLVMAAGIAAVIGSVVLARHQAVTVADLAAIAGVQGSGCSDALRLAEANGMQVVQCDDVDGRVILQIRSPAPALLVRAGAWLHQETPDITAWARADPG